MSQLVDTKPPVTILFPPGTANDDERRSKLRERLNESGFTVEFREGVAPGGSPLGDVVLPIVFILGNAIAAGGIVRANYVAARPFTKKLLENLADVVTDIIREDYLRLPRSQDDTPRDSDYGDAEGPSAGVICGLDIATGEYVGKTEFFLPEETPDDDELGWTRPN